VLDSFALKKGQNLVAPLLIFQKKEAALIVSATSLTGV
jgi:hypothetical protein